jgi:hypothetical protein
VGSWNDQAIRHLLAGTRHDLIRKAFWEIHDAVRILQERAKLVDAGGAG